MTLDSDRCDISVTRDSQNLLSPPPSTEPGSSALPDVNQAGVAASEHPAEARANGHVTPPTPNVPQAARGDALPREFGPYELLQELGRGGMGVVYKARQHSLGRLVAIKMIKSGPSLNVTALRRFIQEAQSAASLDHKNIVAIYEIGEFEDQHYFSMAYVEGSSLTGLVREKGALPPDKAVALLLDVADAIESAHQHGIIHRDLKPDNLLIDRKGRPRVTDFGLAKMMEGGIDLTHSGQILGTPTYMAPEQAMGKPGTIGPHTDVYALGGVLYFVLTGEPPFTGTSVTEVLCQVLHEAPRTMQRANVQVPEALEAVCLKCLAKNPQDRYSSAAEFAAALQAAANQCGYLPTTSPSLGSGSTERLSNASPLDDESVTHVLTAPVAVPRRSRRRKFMALAALTAVLLTAGGLVTYKRWPTLGTPSDESKTGSDARSVQLPPPTRHDFGLKVEMLGVRPNESGVYTLDQGELMRLRIAVDRDAYVGVWTIDPEGTAVLLFPNDMEGNHFIKAGEPRTLPGPGYLFPADTLSTGMEQIRILAAGKAWKRPQGEKLGPFLLISNADHQGVLRGVHLRVLKENDAVAEEALNYQVELPRR